MPNLHANASGLDLHEDKRIKAPVNAASTGNISLSAPGVTLDGVTLVSGNRILLKNQSSPPENGIYVWTGAAVALTRAADADVAADFTLGFLVYVPAGTANASTLWMFSQTAILSLGSTAITFVSLGTIGPTGATGITGPTGPAGAAGPPGPIAALYICIVDQKPQNTQGGTFTAGAFQPRTLTAVLANDGNVAVLNPTLSRITLPAGTFRTRITCPALSCDSNQARLQNITDGTTPLWGTAEFSRSTASSSVHSVIMGRFGLTNTAVLEIQHKCQTTAATNGFGLAANFGPEVYTVAEFWLEGGPPPVALGMSGQLNQQLDVRRRSYAAMMSGR